MKYVPIEKLTSDMVLGQDLYDGAGRILLSKHAILNPEYISNLENLGFQGVYIDEDFTRGIEIKEVLQPEVRREALKRISEMFGIAGLPDAEFVKEQEKLQKTIEKVIENILNNGDIMSNMLDLKTYDDYTYFHSVNVAALSTLIGAHKKMEEEQLTILAEAAVVHDIGKKFLDVDVLNLPRELTEEEREIVKLHCRMGYNFLRRNFDFHEDVATSVLEHHERYDGAGYPDGKEHREIIEYARIISIADVYDAMTSKRPYREALSPSDTMEYLMSEAGRAFDPRIIELFARKIAVYPVGCEVELSNGKRAVVIKNHKNYPLRPKVRLLEEDVELDLNTAVDARSIVITNIIL